MKKKFLFIPLVCSAFIFAPLNAHAEEEVTTTSEEIVETTTEEVVEEKATALEQAKNFKDEWMPKILAALFGASGSGFVATVVWLFIRKYFSKVLDTEEKCESLNASVSGAIETFNAGCDKLEETTKAMKDDFDKIVEAEKEESKARGEEVDELKAQLSALKKIICVLATSNPELIKNGSTQEILEACDESEFVEGVEGND